MDGAHVCLSGFSAHSLEKVQNLIPARVRKYLTTQAVQWRLSYTDRVTSPLLHDPRHNPPRISQRRELAGWVFNARGLLPVITATFLPICLRCSAYEDSTARICRAESALREDGTNRKSCSEEAGLRGGDGDANCISTLLD
jgi:hypothetical protein